MHPILDAPKALRAAFWVLAAFVLLISLLFIISILINTPVYADNKLLQEARQPKFGAAEGKIVNPITKSKEYKTGERISLKDAVRAWDFYTNRKSVVPEKSGLRVMSWNVHMGTDAEGARTDEEIMQVIKEINPDVLALQEFDLTSNLRELYDKYKWVLKCDARFGMSNIIFSQYEITDSVCIPLSDDRVCAKTTVNYNGKKISIYCVHLEVRGDENTRIEQLKRLADDDPHPKILLGDFNSNNERKLQALLKSAKFNMANHSAGSTSIYGGIVDFIYYTGKVKTSDAYYTRASDHLPLWCDV